MMSTYATRTVMVGVGDEGARVLVAARRRLDERMGDGLPIGMVVVADEVPAEVASLPLDFESEALEGAVMAVLREISSIRVSRSSAVDVIFVSTPEDSGSQLAQVSQQVLGIIRERLGGEGRVMNLLLLPDPLANGVTLPVPDESAHEMIRHLSPCLLLAAVNREGFRLADGREELAAEILVQLTATPLGDALWQFATENRCATVGLAALVYQARTASQNWQFVRLVREMVSYWLGRRVAQEERLPQAEAFLLNHSLDPHQVIDKVTSGLPISFLPPLEEFELMENRLSEQLEELQQLQTELEEQVSKEAGVFEQLLVEQLKKWIGQPTDYTLHDLSSFCLALQTTLKRRADFSAQRAEHCYKQLSALDIQKARLARLSTFGHEETGGDAPAMSEGIREWLAMIVRPHRWGSLWRALQASMRNQQVYRATVTERLTLTRQLLRYDLENRYLALALAALIPVISQVAAFRKGVITACDSLGAELVPSDEHLFSLEWSLTEHLNHEALAATYVPSPKSALASLAPFLQMGDGVQKGWVITEPNEIAKHLERAAREQLGALEEIGLSEILEQYVTPEVREKLLLSLVAAAVPFSGIVSADVAYREKVLLGVPSRTTGAIETLLAKSQSPVQVVPGGEAKRITALRVMKLD